MKSLQEMFNKAEENLDNGLETCFASNCDFKTLLKTITQLDDQVFEMLYADDTENSSDYNLNDVDLSLEYSKLERITED